MRFLSKPPNPHIWAFLGLFMVFWPVEIISQKQGYGTFLPLWLSNLKKRMSCFWDFAYKQAYSKTDKPMNRTKFIGHFCEYLKTDFDFWGSLVKNLFRIMLIYIIKPLQLFLLKKVRLNILDNTTITISLCPNSFLWKWILMERYITSVAAFLFRSRLLFSSDFNFWFLPSRTSTLQKWDIFNKLHNLLNITNWMWQYLNKISSKNFSYYCISNKIISRIFQMKSLFLIIWLTYTKNIEC